MKPAQFLQYVGGRGQQQHGMEARAGSTGPLREPNHATRCPGQGVHVRLRLLPRPSAQRPAVTSVPWLKPALLRCSVLDLIARPHMVTPLLTPQTGPDDRQVKALLAALNRPRGLHRTFILPIDVGLQLTRAST